jgi:hypothetical protein
MLAGFELTPTAPLGEKEPPFPPLGRCSLWCKAAARGTITTTLGVRKGIDHRTSAGLQRGRAEVSAGLAGASRRRMLSEWCGGVAVRAIMVGRGE